MLKIKKRQGKSATVSFALCLGISVLCAGVISLIFAEAANLSAAPTGKTGIFSLAALLISAAASGFICAGMSKERGIGFFALVALAAVAIMMITCLICAGGKIGASAFMNYGCYFGTFMLFTLLAKKRRAKARRRFR